MKMLNKVATILLAVPFGSPVQADTEFGEDVPREIVEQFIGNQFGGETTLYSDIFDAFPDFALPAGFDVLASADQGQIQRVILRTELDEATANRALADAFTAEGWTELPAYGQAAPQTGFISATPPPQSLQLCSDTLGGLNVGLSGDGPRYANLFRNNIAAFGGQQQSCAEQAERRVQGPGFRPSPATGGIQQYMPALVMPVSDVPGFQQRGIFGVGGGGSSIDFATESDIAITWSSDELLEHFAAQVEQQGWEADSEAIGVQVAFASWTKTVDGNAMVGTLTLMKTGDNFWDLKFRIVRQGGAGATDRVIGVFP